MKWSQILDGSLSPLTIACWVSVCVWGSAVVGSGMGGHVFGWLTSIQGLGVGSVRGLDAEVGASMI